MREIGRKRVRRRKRSRLRGREMRRYSQAEMMMRIELGWLKMRLSG